jgi:hypothetical protein
MTVHLYIFLTFFFLICSSAYGQISPGELSKAHEQLEGLSNCIKCHEHGKEITGSKCSACHIEIQETFTTRHGFHFINASKSCISCHKEHLGRDAAITLFDEKTFDHSRTGFLLKLKHASVRCESCHSSGYIKNSDVIKSLKGHPRQTYMGLSQQCIDCHLDRHGGTLGRSCQNCHESGSWKPAVQFDHSKSRFPLDGKHVETGCIKCHESMRKHDTSQPLLFTVKEFGDCRECHASPHSERISKELCKSCHSTGGWADVRNFNHSKTAFALTGKHAEVACVQCHTLLKKRIEGMRVEFVTKPFSDCSPCHTSPHGPSFSKKSCSSCHLAVKWSMVSEKKFDHSITSFPLIGKHALLRCDQCHTLKGKQVFRLAKKSCPDCHEDRHHGEFREMYANDCSVCHDEQGFRPSTFSLEKHARTRFALNGAHAAVPCEECHKQQPKLFFHFDKTNCEKCHKDYHKGRFSELMNEKSCDICHSPVDWKMVLFDHSLTTFPLIGFHASVACSRCHLKGSGGTTEQYHGTSKECADCHVDQHDGQFANKGKTNCALCHSPLGRRALLFRHDIHSTFALTGAHAKVECGGCHKPELRNGKNVVHYRPLSSNCESCHQGKK